jgi:hypothetical protein
MSDIKGFPCMAKINQDSPIYKRKLEATTKKYI